MITTLKHTIEKVTFGYSFVFRKWVFKVGETKFLVKCHGREQGEKVARILNESIKRSGNIDNLARANINQVCGG